MEETTTVPASAKPPRPLASPELQAALRQFDTLDDQINTLTEQLSALKFERKEVGEVTITDLVNQEDVQYSGITTDDGTEYTFERDIHASVGKGDKPVAFAWLAERKLDHLLKNHIVISFPKDSVESAKKIKSLIAQILPEYQIGIKVGEAPDKLVDAITTMLMEAGLFPAVKITTEQELPGATLSAFVKKCLTAGINLPPEFGVFAPMRATKVLPPPTSEPQPATEPVATS